MATDHKRITTTKANHEPVDNAPTSPASTSIYNLKLKVKSLTSADAPLKVKYILLDILTHLENK